ncbi:MAG: HAMP domain-containing protein [Anaerolineae bacterium]|nr:HAMP domain-containing protein [Anaerolineae bacterium]
MKTLSLTRQLTSIAVISIFITAMITGLPALWLFHRELDRQIDLRLTAGEQHTRTIWALTELQMSQTVELASERPTLHRLLEKRNWTALEPYLADFRTDTILDFLYIKNEQNIVLAGAVPETGALQATERVLGDDITLVGGFVVDARFLDRLHEQTGFLYRFPASPTDPGQGYRARRVQLSSDLALTVLIDTDDTQSVQTSAIISIVAIALVSAGAGSLISGLYMRRRIRPLGELRRAAQVVGEGDFTRKINVGTYSPEIRTLADTLETTRQRIRLMMQQLQEERDWSNTVMQSIVEGIVTINPQGEIVFHSQSARQIMHWQQDQVGEQVDHAFRLADSDQSFSACLPPEGSRKSLQVCLPNGYPIMLAVTRARTLPDGAIPLVLRDITEENRQSSAQAYYLANMSHEFRTPLSGMKALVELLIDNDRSLARNERQQLFTSLLMSMSSLQRLIDNLLEGSKLEAQKFSLHRQPAQIEQILTDALHTMQPLLKRRQQPLTLDLPLSSPLIEGDHTRLVQVVVNLLSNASKYSPDAAEINLSVNHNPSELWLGIADRGQGVPLNQQEAIFQPFVRLEQSAQADHSTGLGLSVVRGIIEAHGGKVGVNAREGGGSIFWFLIPLPRENVG